MTTELWITNILSAGSVLIGGWLLISSVFPQLEIFLSGIIKEQKVLHSFMALLNILLLWMVAQGVIIYLLKIKNVYLNYLEVIMPALDVFWQFIPFMQYIILGSFIVLAFKKK